MVIDGYYINGYYGYYGYYINGYCGYSINGYYGYSINGYWLLFYKWIMVVILLMTING
jgi:hypothetical protein